MVAGGMPGFVLNLVKNKPRMGDTGTTLHQKYVFPFTPWPVGEGRGTGSPPNPAAIQETSPTPLPALLCNTTPPGCTSVLPPSLKPGPVGLVHPTQEQLPKLMTSLLLNAAVHSQPSLSSSRGCHSGLLHFPVPLTCPP